MSSAESTSSNSEIVMVNGQVVACEVEIDGFDVQYEEEEEPNGSQEYEGDPNDYYQYDLDSDAVYLLDEDTDQIHQLNPGDEHVEEQEIDVEYVEHPTSSSSSSSGPSTSTSSSSSSLPSTSGIPMNSRSSSGGITSSGTIPNTYLIRKAMPMGKPATYSPVTFHTTYTESMNRRGKRVIKRTHMPMSPEEMETMLEDAHVLKRLQAEITTLRKSNDGLKKDYEEVQKRLEAVNNVMNEAKQKNREANEEKKQLLRELSLARSRNAQTVKQMCPEPRFNF